MSDNPIINEKVVDLVEYQEDAIISRTLIEKEGGTVTLFAFAEGENISKHTASHEALAQVMEGKVEFIISGDKYQLEAGEMVIMPGGKPHSLRALSSSKMLLVMID